MLRTIPAIALATGYAAHQVKHVVRTQRIKATVRVGAMGTRLFGESGARRIVEALRRSARRPPVAAPRTA